MNPELEAALAKFDNTWGALSEIYGVDIPEERKQQLYADLSAEVGFEVKDMGDVYRLKSDPAFAAARERQGERFGGAPLDYTQQAVNSALFELPDNLLRGLGIGEGYTQRLEDRRLTNPTASFLASGAGAMVPVGGLLGIGTRPFRAAQTGKEARTIWQMAGRTAGLTGAEGAVTGLGMTDNPDASGYEYLGNILGGGLIGTAAGGAIGAAGGYFRGRRAAYEATGPGRTRRIQEGLGEAATGQPVRPGPAVRHSAQESIDQSKVLYKQFEEQVPFMDDEKTRGFLNYLRASPDNRKYLRGVSIEVAEDMRSPAFQEMQTLRSNLLRAKEWDLHDELNRIMEDVIPGFQVANRSYRRGMEMLRQFDNGAKMLGKDPDDIAAHVKGLTDPNGNPLFDQQEAFRMGMINRAMFQLGQSDTRNPTGLLKKLFNMPEESLTGFDSSMRQMFTDEASYQTFRRLVREERSAQELLAHVQQWARPIMIAMTFGGGMAIGGGLSMGGANYFGNLLATMANN